MIPKSAFRVCLSVVMAALTEVAFATPIEIDIDTTQSSVNVQFCLGANCSTDSSPVTGLTALKLDSIAAPTMLELHDFFYALTETINIALTGLTATGTNITIDYATPGLPQPPDVLGGGGAFVLIDVPANQSGSVNYTATGTTCFLLVLAGYPCVDAISLADQGTQLGDYSGTVVPQPGRIVQFQIQPNISGPLDPANPALGTLTITGNIVGQATVPLHADADLNGVIDGRDIGPFVEVLVNPAAQSWQRRFAVDMDDDDEFDILDAALFADCLLNQNCGN